MSRTPVSTGHFSILEIRRPRRCARGTPRRLMPIITMSLQSLLFSTTSWARRTSVSSISEADISLPLVRRACFPSASLIERCPAVSLDGGYEAKRGGCKLGGEGIGSREQGIGLGVGNRE